MTPILSTAPASLGPTVRKPSSSQSRLVITTADVILGCHCCSKKRHYREDFEEV
jgi:hypothetical protein